MIISHKHRFIFLKTRKTAGTSLEIGLSQHCGAEDVITAISPDDETTRSALGYRGPQNHLLTADRCGWLGRLGKKRRRKLKNHDAASTVKAFVGDKIWTTYYKFSIERDPFDKALSLYWWEHRDDPSPQPLSDYLAGDISGKLTNWPIYTIDDVIAVDHVIRYENLSAEVAALADRLGVPSINMVRAKGSFRADRRPYHEVLTEFDRRRITAICAKEIAAFGYAWPAVRQASRS